VHFSITNGAYGVILTLVSSTLLILKLANSLVPFNHAWYKDNVLNLILLGCISNFANQCGIIACFFDKASRIASTLFLSVLFSYVTDVLVFGVSLHIVEVIGALFIVVCSSFTMVLKYLNYLN